jgi:hypothetical protein
MLSKFWDLNALKTMIRTILLLTLGFSLTSCRFTKQQPLPNSEILYYRDDYPTNYLGFVQSNGEDNQLLEIHRKLDRPVWSLDGQFLFGLSGGKASMYGFPTYWDFEKGRFKMCKNLGELEQIQGAGNPENPYEVILNNNYQIMLFDLSNCKLQDTIVDYNDRRAEISELCGFSYSHFRQSLVYATRTWDEKASEVINPLMHLDLNTGETTQLALGVRPSWSPDGSQIAYYGIDGLYVLSVFVDGAEPRRLVDQHFYKPNDTSHRELSSPSWSPDGKWLAYHRCGEVRFCNWQDAIIYKVPSDGGQEEIIVAEGESPSWRP